MSAPFASCAPLVLKRANSDSAACPFGGDAQMSVISSCSGKCPKVDYLQVHERQGGKVHEYEEVTDKGEMCIFKLMRHHDFKFFLCQKRTLLTLGTDMELRKDVALYLAVVMGTAYDSFRCIHVSQMVDSAK